MWSSRVPVLRGNRLARALARLRDAGHAVVDLTESNPTRVGLRYPARLLDPLGSARGLVYEPAPLGLRAARDAVARYLRRLDLPIESTRVVLTASTSEAYAVLFKLLCSPGDAVLVPRPSYPLFEHLTQLEGIDTVPYALEYDGCWEINLASLRDGMTPRVRAILVVNPNNPTGGFVSTSDLETLTCLCREHELALIADEVFGVYPMLETARGSSVFDRPAQGLTFCLGGLSKAVGLPQVKLGWIAATGPTLLVEQALARLELICDTYLSVGTPVQLAAAHLLEAGAAITAQIAARVRRNYATLCAVVDRYPDAQLLRADGGWYAVVQVPATQSEEALVLDVLERERVLIHPGYFFDFPREAFLVLSLLPEPAPFEDAADRALAHAAPRP